MTVTPRRAAAGAVVGIVVGIVAALAGCTSPSADDVGAGASAPTSAPAVLPPVTPPPSVDVSPAPGPSGPRPENGAVVVERGTTGHGELSVRNGTDLDALVTLALDGVATRAVYVRASATAELTGVADGTYDVFVAQGDGWNRELRRFTDSPEYARFTDPAPFETVREAGAIEYTRLDLTVAPVVGGTARTVPVDPDSVPT